MLVEDLEQQANLQGTSKCRGVLEEDL